MKEKAYLSGIGVVLMAAMFAGGPAASGAEPAWSVEKLPGCDNLSARMASYYEAVKVKVTAAAPQY
ncbi:MAG TPA: hypothetical protein VMZ50_06135, partial [Phycisphaerae bacterium]|nr:hypothetical protein [Phycisphaerae bacterium]